jgi:hemolysin III
MVVKNKYKRPQSLGEEIANAVSHGIGAIFGIVSLVLFLMVASTWQEYVAGTVFSLAIFSLFISSTLYHAFPESLKVKRLFKRFDHISIYFLIGASFAPLLLVVADQPLGYIFFGVQWLIILVGVVFKAIFIDKFQVIHLVMFLLLGWSALLLLGQFEKLSSAAIWLTISGGLAYSFGVIFYVASRKFKYAHFIWHLFVLAGVILHFIGNFGFIFLVP